jgi:hypothetical protein
MSPEENLREKLDQALGEVELTSEDVAWTVQRADALIALGMSREMAVTFASNECVDRIKEKTILEVLDQEDAAQDRRKAEGAIRHQEARSDLKAKGTEGQRPSLKTSLGDLLARKSGTGR